MKAAQAIGTKLSDTGTLVLALVGFETSSQAVIGACSFEAASALYSKQKEVAFPTAPPETLEEATRAFVDVVEHGNIVKVYEAHAQYLQSDNSEMFSKTHGAVMACLDPEVAKSMQAAQEAAAHEAAKGQSTMEESTLSSGEPVDAGPVDHSTDSASGHEHIAGSSTA